MSLHVCKTTSYAQGKREESDKLVGVENQELLEVYLISLLS